MTHSWHAFSGELISRSLLPTEYPKYPKYHSSAASPSLAFELSTVISHVIRRVQYFCAGTHARRAQRRACLHFLHVLRFIYVNHAHSDMYTNLRARLLEQVEKELSVNGLCIFTRGPGVVYTRGAAAICARAEGNPALAPLAPPDASHVDSRAGNSSSSSCSCPSSSG